MHVMFIDFYDKYLEIIPRMIYDLQSVIFFEFKVDRN